MDIQAWRATPFFTDAQRAMAQAFEDWVCGALLPALAGRGIALDDPASHTAQAMEQDCRLIARLLGQGGWLDSLADSAVFSVRSLVLQREVLARYAPLADFVFAMQALGAASVLHGGSAAQQAQYLPQIVSGEVLCAFALSESAAGSDAAALTCQARPQPDGFVVQGEKCWISHGQHADVCILFARSAETPKPQHGISAFVVERHLSPWRVCEEFTMLAPHPLARIAWDGVGLPAAALLGAPQRGYALALQVLQALRSSVAAAALGMARAALQRAIGHAKQRSMYGGVLADQAVCAATLAQQAASLDGAGLLCARAAWLYDCQPQDAALAQAVAQAKWQATEHAQQIIDRAQQVFGAAAMCDGHPLARLYREVRALRIYEGASEVQQHIVARSVLQQGV
ncbi:acyl-CoA dehydrogenase family protein [Massilia sp. W12]|uniref:acyl-CoA dehydrogenase family protein n=1 Tax=Massilia sp. W12 TaxID=3126507 RepID=UPI0030CC68E0